MNNIQITRIQKERFIFEDKWVTPRSQEREVQRKLNTSVKTVPITEEAAISWAAELDKKCSMTQGTPDNIDRGGWSMLQEYKSGEEYNRWHTLDDCLNYGALLRGIHNIQERGGTGEDETRFLNRVRDRFGHNHF